MLCIGHLRGVGQKPAKNSNVSPARIASSGPFCRPSEGCGLANHRSPSSFQPKNAGGLVVVVGLGGGDGWWGDVGRLPRQGCAEVGTESNLRSINKWKSCHKVAKSTYDQFIGNLLAFIANKLVFEFSRNGSLLCWPTYVRHLGRSCSETLLWKRNENQHLLTEPQYLFTLIVCTLNAFNLGSCFGKHWSSLGPN